MALPSIPSDRALPATTAKELAPPPRAASNKSEVSVPSATPVITDEPSMPTERSTTSGRPHLGRATAQIWIGSPPVDDIHSMFPPEHREKIREVSVHKPTDPNTKYALVYFNSVEDASAAIETLDHPKIKFGTEYVNRSQGRGGGFSSRGSYNQGSYESRKSGDSDRGFGRGGRGGRGGSIRGSGSSGPYSRGTSSPGPTRGGPGRGRGGYSHVSGDRQEWTDRPDSKEASWPNEEKAPMPPAHDEHPSDPPTATTTVAASTTGTSTVGESQQSSS